MKDNIKDVEQGFALLKYALISSIVLDFILMLFIDENTTYASNINSLPQLIRAILFILGSYKLKDVNDSLKKFHTLALVTTFPTIVLSVLGVSMSGMEAYLLSNMENPEMMGNVVTIMAVGLVISLAIIVLSVFMYKRLTEGVKNWVKLSYDSKFKFIETLANQYYRRELTINVYLPLGLFLGMMMLMVAPTPATYFVSILMMVISIYSIIHLVKSFTFFSVCEKSAPAIMSNSNISPGIEQ